jgi:hypothetical protein
VGHKVLKYANKTLEDISNENKALKTAGASMNEKRKDSAIKYRKNAVGVQNYQKILSRPAEKEIDRNIKSLERARRTGHI